MADVARRTKCGNRHRRATNGEGLMDWQTSPAARSAATDTAAPRTEKA
ncbi:hypothetical protein [Microbacterium rhizomatis]|nr:hypothetical protein [Microbacterium rhizomatis]